MANKTNQNDPADHKIQLEDVVRPKSQEKIMTEQVEEGEFLYNQDRRSLFFSSLSAGMDIGFSVFFITTITTLVAGHLPEDIVHAVGTLGYPIGFVLVIIGRAVLFTEQTTLSVLPILSGKRKFYDLLKLWGFVLLGNLLGGYVIAGLVVWFGPAMQSVSIESIAFLGEKITSHSGPVIFGSAILAGWLMAMLSWLVTSSQETISRIILVVMITYFIGLGYLHHSIVGSIEVFSSMLVSEKVTFLDYLQFLLFAVSGNAVGGIVFVAIMKYKSVVKIPEPDES